MKLIFTKQETRDMVMEHIATKLGIDVNNKELDLNFREYNNIEYCAIDIIDKKPVRVTNDKHDDISIDPDDFLPLNGGEPMEKPR